MRRRILTLCFMWCCFLAGAQEYFPKNDGVKTTKNNYTAFTNAKIHIGPTEVIENGTLLIRKGKVIASGTSVNIPDNSIVIDLKGKYIYPSFIDLYSEFGMEKPKRQNGSVQYDSKREGYYWNDHILPDRQSVENFNFDKNKAKDLVENGFGVVNTHIADGIVRGTGILVTLDPDGDNNERILDQRSAQFLSFSKSATSSQSYPTSLMGAMALLRQLYYDADWYVKGNSETKDMAIEALLENKGLPQIFDAGNKLNVLRAGKIGDEFGIKYIIKGNGDEYERINEIKEANVSLIVPLNFPNAYDVTDPYQASKVSLSDMRHWNQAPSNLATLAKNEISFALTASDNKKTSEFRSNLLKAIKYGLDPQIALKALTTVPARLLGKSNEIGTLKNGAYANFLITSGPIFDKESTLYENWVQGNRNIINDMYIQDIRGEYTLKTANDSFTLSISGKIEKPGATVKKDTIELASKFDYNDGWVTLFFDPSGDDKTTYTRLSAKVTDAENLSGNGILANGTSTQWEAIKTAGLKEEKKKEKKAESTPPVVPVTFPNKAYGFNVPPKAETILFRNATVWTNEEAGILEHTDVLVTNGKITKIGNDLSASGAKVIDATGKHLTSGIIDEHSHIAADAINESGHNSSAEVSIEDVVNPEDINIYRNLSGGVTTIQILHGSANPIGGRSALIKLKWGRSAADMLIDNAPKFIKFALGENVKQSNWGSNQTIRFPQTRMGVEQVFTDYFQRAKEYKEQWNAYAKLSGRSRSKARAPRYDIEMETISEILDKNRFISCHSYVQSEINMLMKVAEKFNFNINTFTHILEGYKLADKMVEHGAGGSTFSDWWAYKYEVNDAIPYNAAIMHDAGVTVAINSDDAEMSRRLNQEAAKTVKYGGVSEEDAWKFITLNPAKLLHLDDKTGSIKEGKDADLVLWSNHPLSIYAIAEKTMIEGVVYYDYEDMKKKQLAIQEERNELINQMISAKNNGMKTQAPKQKEEKLFHCDTL